MSMQAAQQFRDIVCKTPGLQEQVQSAIAGGNGLAESVALGKQCGCEFTGEELAEVLQSVADDELSEFELNLVAGGTSMPEGDCDLGRILAAKKARLSAPKPPAPPLVIGTPNLGWHVDHGRWVAW